MPLMETNHLHYDETVLVFFLSGLYISYIEHIRIKQQKTNTYNLL